ncbi:MAG: hypothetical protein WBP16_14765 [Ferruginibacter sp.]
MITQAAQYIIILSGLWLIIAGIIMLIKPTKAKNIIAKAGSTNLINYTELGLRGIWAVAVLLYAPLSKFPVFFKLFGIMLGITTLILLLIPRKWHAAFAVWSSSKLTTPLLRLSAPFAIGFALFLIYAVSNT